MTAKAFLLILIFSKKRQVLELLGNTEAYVFLQLPCIMPKDGTPEHC